MSLRIGIDCGGTNTDAVVLDASDRVLGWAKRTTTEPDVLAGVQQAVTAALRGAGRGPEEVAAVMLGTTQFVNACVQLRGLSPVAVVRLCGPATHSLPPFCDMPPALRQAVGGAYFLADGGLEFDGCSEIAPLHERQLRGIARRILAAGIRCVVVAGVFAPVQAAQEQRAAAILLDEAAVAAAEAAAGLQGGGGGKADDAAAAGPAGGISEPALLVCLSHEIGQLGLLERENAAILNAALLPLARRVVPACEAALSAAGIAAPLLFCSNDGTLLPAAAALKLPVATFQSGPVNSLRGAALLTGLKHAAVIDIGGTTTDVGLLVGGLPRPAPRVTLLAGAPTNFQMPDVLSIGLGGGSLLRFPAAPAAGTLNQAAGMQEDLSVRCSVGPDSVGAALEQQALCFGGPTATASDAAALLGRMQLGSRQAVAAGLSGEQAQAAWEQMQRLFEGALDRAKTEAGDLPVIVVGGGAPLCGDGLAGASAVLRPHHAAVANAVGAAICQVSGAVDAVYDMGGTAGSRAAVLEQAQQLAEQRAVAAGAKPGSCWVASREEVPLAYLAGSATRVRIKVIGELDVARLRDSAPGSGSGGSGGRTTQGSEVQAGEQGTADGGAPVARQPAEPAGQAVSAEGRFGGNGSSSSGTWGDVSPAVECWPPLPGRGNEPPAATLAEWRPVLGPAGEWLLHEPDLHLIALGAGILGCGGGGSPSKALLKAVMELQRTEPGGMRVVSLSSLSNDALVADCGYMGAPTVSLEKLDSTHTAEAAVQASLDAYGAELAASAASAAGPSSTAGAAGPSGPSSGAGGSAPSPAAAPPPNLTALLSFEMGGGNGLEPLVVGAGSRMGLPVVDADLMGRAFPEMQMTTAAIYGAPILPTALADEKGNAVVVHRAASPAWLERLLRPVCTEMGCSAGCSDCPLTGQQLKRVAVPRSLSLAWHLGSAVAQAQHAKRDAAEAIADAGGGRVLFRGKVIDVQRSTTAGFARGTLLLERGSGGSNRGAGDFSSSASGRSGGSRSSGGDGGGSAVVSSPKQRLRIHFQNENLVAEELGADEAQAGQAGGQWATAHHPAALPAAATAEASSSRDGSSGGGSSGARVLATVPDLICCIEEDTGQPIATEEMRYGLRAAVVGLPAHPLLTTTQALAVVGPAAFGHGEVAYVPLGRYAEPSSIPR